MSIRSSVLRLTVMAVAAAPLPALAADVFFDTFDAETPGTYPSTFDNTVVGPNVSILVTSDASTSPNNSVRIANPLNEGYETSRFFDPNVAANGTVALAGLQYLDLGYSLNVESIPNGATTGNAGSTIALGQGSPGGYASSFPGSIRFFSAGSDTTKYNLYNGTFINPTPLNVGQFYDILTRILPDPNTPGSGTILYFIDGVQVSSLNYSGAPAAVNGVRINTQNGTGAPVNTTFLLDDLYVNIPEPASLSLLAAASGLLLLRPRK
jgi:hypothetical protein